MATGNFGNSEQLVAISDVIQNTVILRDGSLRQIIMVGGTNFSLKSEEEQNLLVSSYQNFLNSIDFPLQILIRSRKINIQKYLADLDGRVREETSPLLQNQIGEYREFVRQFVAENAIMEKSFFVVIPWYSHLGAKKSQPKNLIPFFRKKESGPPQDEHKELLKANLPQLAQRVEQVMAGLAGLELDTMLLGDEALLELFYNFYNPGTTSKEEKLSAQNSP